jgi:predicted neuraminidase
MIFGAAEYKIRRILMSDNPLEPVKITPAVRQRHFSEARGYQGIPGVEVSRGGRLWATWYSGGDGEGPDNFALLVSSDDNGKTWGEPVSVVDPPGKVRAYDPALWTDPSGRLWWFWSQSFSPEIGKISDGRAGVWAAFTENPESATPCFSEPVRIANGVMLNKPTVLSNGEWALPTAVWVCENPRVEELDSERFSNMTVSSDSGTSFQLRGGADIHHRCFDEHMIVELKDRRLWMLVRTYYGIGQSFSSDGGETWSKGENSKLGGPNARFFIRRLSSGRLLLVNHTDISPAEAAERFINGETWRKRSRLTALLSDDDGRSWKGGLVLDGRGGVSYPDGVEDSDGLIRVIYDHERYKEGEILMASFREDDILAGNAVSSDCRLMQIVSKTGGVGK